MERPTRLTASRIIGWDLSKKTLVGCSLSEKDGFQRKRFFSGQMNAAVRSKLASTLGSTDAVFMEGGSPSFTLARYLLNHTESQVFVLNPMQLHIIFESMCKTDKQDAAKIAKYTRDAHPENWVLILISIPTEQESAEQSIVKLHIAYSHLRTKVVNKLHAVFNGQDHPDLKKSNFLSAPPNAAAVPLMPQFLVQGKFKVQVDILQLCPRPKVLSQELQAGLDARVVIEAL